MLIAISQGLTLMIPFMLMGSFSVLLISLPIEAYQSFMFHLFGTGWTVVLQNLYAATFGILSLSIVMTVSNQYITDASKKTKSTADPIIGSVLALACFVALLGITSDTFSMDSLGTTGLFLAVLTSAVAARLYIWLSACKGLSLSVFTDGVNPVFNSALKAIYPAAFTLIPFVLVGTLFQSIGQATINHWVSENLLSLFERAGDTLPAALLFTGVIHLFWFMGIHGNNMLDFVSQNLYTPAALENHSVFILGGDPTLILTKPFFDTFVLMGGAGTTLCLLVAIFIWSDKSNMKRHGFMALLPSLFNINELVLFGIPVVMNPIYLIPFLGVPLVITVVSYSAIAFGLVPYTHQSVEWTTPILLSGYLVTGSVAGSLLQLVNLTVGVAIYKPFLIYSEKISSQRDLVHYQQLVDVFKETEQAGFTQWFSRRSSITGNVARVLITELELAIKANELTMHYQPQFDVEYHIIGLESLLRWRHSRYGYIYPPLILALAEEGELTETLSKWIIDRVMSDSLQLHQLGYKTMISSINLSAKQLESEAVINWIFERIDTHHLSVEQITIEITEHLALSNDPRIHDALTRINDFGIPLAMDDFGMGHSSLMYLKSHTFDTIKLDGSLVRDIVGNTISQEIVSSIDYLSQSLGFKILAEYVESEEQKSKLFDLGCSYYQGYLFSAALSFEDLIRFLERTDSPLGVDTALEILS